ncbi:hypothetical protein C1072_003587 [Escherichia coli O157]|nr:hypothetical protein [Escherichia coli O157]
MLCSRGGLLCLPDQLHFVNTVLTARLHLNRPVTGSLLKRIRNGKKAKS